MSRIFYASDVASLPPHRRRHRRPLYFIYNYFNIMTDIYRIVRFSLAKMVALALKEEGESSFGNDSLFFNTEINRKETFL